LVHRRHDPYYDRTSDDNYNYNHVVFLFVLVLLHS
jgi:hypothetical protein